MTAEPDSFSPRQWQLAAGRSLALGPQAVIMAIVNVTPDSFSDGGRYRSVDSAVESALAMAQEGAHILDIGGESTRPGADPVTAAEEQARVLPVIEALAARTSVPISIDTYRAQTARRGLEAGACIVNDVWGFQREPEIADIAAEAGAGVVIMHTGREREKDPDVIADQQLFLGKSLEIARTAGVAENAIVLDPGFGFAKSVDENCDLMHRFGELHAFGLPLVAGTSRKRFVGAVGGGLAAVDRDVATAATSVVLRLAGAAIFRVHNVAINKDALVVADAMVARRCLPPTERPS